MVTSYAALSKGIHFSLIDEQGEDPHLPAGKNQIVAYQFNRTPYPRIYKGGRLPKSHAKQIGKIDLPAALEQSSNPYFAVLAGDYLSNPQELADVAASFGFGKKTDIEISGEVKGNLPNYLKTNRTGLYSFAIGQHTLLSTPLQAANLLSTIANGGKVLKNTLIHEKKGFSPNEKTLSSFDLKGAFAEKELSNLGIHFALFTGAQSRTDFILQREENPFINQILPFPPSVRQPILEGMDRVIWGKKGNARPISIRSLLINPSLMELFLSLKHQMVGKTSTAEFTFNPNKNPSSKAQTYKHSWFGAISFQSDKQGKVHYERPELAVLVFLRFGESGKEGAPIAAQMIHKWREISQKYSKEK